MIHLCTYLADTCCEMRSGACKNTCNMSCWNDTCSPPDSEDTVALWSSLQAYLDVVALHTCSIWCWGHAHIPIVCLLYQPEMGHPSPCQPVAPIRASAHSLSMIRSMQSQEIALVGCLHCVKPLCMLPIKSLTHASMDSNSGVHSVLLRALSGKLWCADCDDSQHSCAVLCGFP